MYPKTGIRRYWNQRQDPLDWKRSVTANGAGWQRAYETFLSPATRDAVELLGDLVGKRLLELACGQGYGSLHLRRRGASVTGIDVSDRRCASARRLAGSIDDRGAARFCAASAESLPFADGSFDRIFSRDVLMYADPERIAGECARVLVPGGLAVFVESLRGNPLLGLFRRCTSPAQYREFTRHLSWREMACFGDPLRLVVVRPYYLLSLSAFVCLFVLRSAVLHRWFLRILHPLDRQLLKSVPSLSRFAWRATALYVKSERSG